MDDVLEAEVTPTITTAAPGTPTAAPGWTLTDAEVSPSVTAADVRPAPPLTDPAP